MKKNIKKFSFISLFLILIFSNISVYASSYSDWSTSDKSKYVRENIEGFLLNQTGICYGGPNKTILDTIRSIYDADYATEGYTDYSDWFEQFITFNRDDSSFSITPLGSDVLNKTAAKLKEDSGYYYVYSVDINSVFTTFNNGIVYNKLKNIIKSNPNSYVVYSGQYWSSLYIQDISDKSFVFSSYTSSYKARYVNLYDNNSWKTVEFDYYSWDKNSESFNKNSSTANISFLVLDTTTPYNYTNYNNNYLYTDGVKAFICFKTLNDLKGYSLGQPLYYEIDTSNLPQLTTSNISSYNSSYSAITNSSDSSVNNSNNVYDYSQVSNIVNNYITNNYGSGNDDNNNDGGHSSGGNGSSSNDWSWVDKIANFVTELISQVGKILGAIADGLTSILEVISEKIPNVIGQLVSYVLPFLPEEITALIALPFILGVIVFVVNLFRG